MKARLFHKERFWVAVCALGTILVPLTLFGPATIYCTNPVEFRVGLFSILSKEILPILLIFIALTSILLILPSFLYRLCVCLTIGIGLAIYIQGNFLLWNYGIFDGHIIPWDKFSNRALIDLTVWIIVIGGISFSRSIIFAHAIFISLILVGIQSFSLAVLLFQKAPPLFKEHTERNYSEVFNFSKKKNVVVILLDEFYGPAFYELIDQFPEYKEKFNGFTFYKNTLSSFPTTYPSIPTILSGVPYVEGASMTKYFDNTATQGMPHILADKGFNSSLVTFHPICDHNTGGICVGLKEIVTGDWNRVETGELLKLLDVTLFRYFPQTLKKFIYNNDSWFLQSLNSKKRGSPQQEESILFFERFNRESKVISEKPTFKFLHFLIPHAPYRLTKECVAQEFKTKYRNKKYLNHAECALTLALGVIDRLKELEIFDNSLVIVTADHGSTGAKFKSVKERKDFRAGLNRAFPLLLIKPFGQPKPFSIFEAPATLSDIPATVFEQLGILESVPGRSILSLSETEIRDRRYYHYKWRHSYWFRDILPNLIEFSIKGPAWDFNSWTRLSKDTK